MAGLNTSSDLPLREDTSRVVQVDIFVDSWPAGPSNPSFEGIDNVHFAADEHTLFERRVARPGRPFLNRPRQYAFIPPVFVPNSPLDVPLAISPGKDHSTTRRANPGGSPLPPPTALVSCLPDFAHCVSHLCGHPSRADFHLQGADAYLDVGPGGEDEWGAYCHRCGDGGPPGPRRTMHELPCGHMLCPSHLGQVASDAVETFKSRLPIVRQALREAAGELARVCRDLVPRETAPRMRESQERRLLFFRRELLAILGLSCCGRDMRLVEDWLCCLDEWVARQLWAVCWRLFRGCSMDGTVYCGWPDCCAAIPAWCGYDDAREERVYYCVACEGNSMWLEHKGCAFGPRGRYRGKSTALCSVICNFHLLREALVMDLHT